jgi:hypothetical protein
MARPDDAIDLDDHPEIRFPTEGDLLNHIILLAKAWGWAYYHPFRSDKSVIGYPDLTLVRKDDGRLIFVEVKKKGGPLRPEQWEWLEALGKTCAEVYLWEPSDINEIVKVLT